MAILDGEAERSHPSVREIAFSRPSPPWMSALRPTVRRRAREACDWLRQAYRRWRGAHVSRGWSRHLEPSRSVARRASRAGARAGSGRERTRLRLQAVVCQGGPPRASLSFFLRVSAVNHRLCVASGREARCCRRITPAPAKTRRTRVVSSALTPAAADAAHCGLDDADFGRASPAVAGSLFQPGVSPCQPASSGAPESVRPKRQMPACRRTSSAAPSARCAVRHPGP